MIPSRDCPGARSGDFAIVDVLVSRADRCLTSVFSFGGPLRSDESFVADSIDLASWPRVLEKRPRLGRGP